MKNPLRSILGLAALFTIALSVLLWFAPAANAQAPAADPAVTLTPAPPSDQSAAVANAAIETAAAVAQPFIVQLALKHPWLVTLLALIATLRLVFKPLVSAFEAHVRSTPQSTDDEAFDRVTHSRAFRVGAWFLDYFGSIKVGPQFTAKPKAGS